MIDKRLLLSRTFTKKILTKLKFDGVTEVPTPSTGLLPTLNRIYTSIKNRIDVATSYMNGDQFTCKWKTVTILATTPFTRDYNFQYGFVHQDSPIKSLFVFQF